MVLLEGHSFIKFLPSNEQSHYFCLIRVAQKHPCVVLHIGHMEGTPYSLQLDTVSSLLKALKNLLPPIKERGGATPSKKKPPVSTKGKPIVTVLVKQLQRVMIR